MSLFQQYRSVTFTIAAGLILAAILVTGLPLVTNDLARTISSLSDTTAFDERPVFVGRINLREEGAGSRPYAISLHGGFFYVSYQYSPTVTVLDSNLSVVREVDLGHGDSTWITGMAVDDARIYVADFYRGEIRFHDLRGNLIEAFSWLPGKQGRLKPHGMALHEGVLYVTDVLSRRILAVSVEQTDGITEEGELLLSVPAAGEPDTVFQCPASAEITPDGRILVADSKEGSVKVFTCAGAYAYSFSMPAGTRLYGPHGMAQDNLPDPAALAKNTSSFDPSGIREMGRIHVVDSDVGDVVLFDATGRYITRYGASKLHGPTSIAVDRNRRLIVVTDTKDSDLVVFHY